ncbi:MAG: glycosyltransferase family 39 protein [Deltaproteobacteria bacterium]|nr:glycosyltransferase family 39 protein [Deltaproteobacteria bacterium]
MNFQRLNTLKKFIGPTILVLVGSYMLHRSWFKWPDLFIDYGRELYIPWQITQGKVLYAEIHHLYGPFAQYLNAFLFQIFGTGLSTLAYFNICMVILLSIIIYDLFKSSFGSLIATTAGICFLMVFAFSQYGEIGNYNFVCPYSHEITYGIILFFLTLFIFKNYLANPKPIYLSLIGFMIGLMFLTKVEIFIAGFISILSGLIFVFWRLKPFNPRKQLFNLLLFFFLPVIAFFIYFSFQMPLIEAFNSIIASYKNIFIGPLVTNIFYLRISGFDNPAQNIALMFRQFGGYLIFFIFTGLLSYLFARVTNRKIKYAGIIITFLVIILITFSKLLSINWEDIARPYPIFLSLLLISLVTNLILKREDRLFVEKYLPFILLTLFSLLLLFKMILNVHLFHYGFALAMPASLVMTALLLHYAPMLISPWDNKNIVAGFIGLFIFLTLLAYLNLTKNIYDLKTYPVAEGRDRFLTFNEKFNNNGPIVNETIKYIDKLMSEKDTFIVLPEGIMINYLTRRINPSRYFEFTPNIVEAIGEEKIINEFSSTNPSFIILLEKDTSEHGARYFGKDYALNIYSWIINNYDKVLQVGEEPFTGNGFGISIAGKKK